MIPTHFSKSQFVTDMQSNPRQCRAKDYRSVMCFCWIFWLYMLVLIACGTLCVLTVEMFYTNDRIETVKCVDTMVIANATLSTVTICCYTLIMTTMFVNVFYQQHGEEILQAGSCPVNEQEIEEPGSTCPHLTMNISENHEDRHDLNHQNGTKVIAYVTNITSLSMTTWGIYDMITLYGCLVMEPPLLKFFISCTLVQFGAFLLSTVRIALINRERQTS